VLPRTERSTGRGLAVYQGYAEVTDEERWNTALFIAIEDLNNPNSETRKKAIDAGCFVEFMEVRQQLIEEAHRKHVARGSLSDKS
jgi:hypothetical protein